MSEVAEVFIEDLIEKLEQDGWLEDRVKLKEKYENELSVLRNKNKNLRDRNTRLHRELKKHIDLLKPKGGVGVK